MQRGKLIVLLALAVAVGWHDIIWAVDMISSEQCLSRVWSHTFAHPAACVWCHYAERMFIVLPAVVWYDIIRARSVTWSESHMCSFLTACVMSLCTEERKVDCTPRPCCYSWLIHVWSGQGLSRGWSHTCGRPSQQLLSADIVWCHITDLGSPLPPSVSDGFCNSGRPLCLTYTLHCMLKGDREALLRRMSWYVDARHLSKNPIPEVIWLAWQLTLLLLQLLLLLLLLLPLWPNYALPERTTLWIWRFRCFAVCNKCTLYAFAVCNKCTYI